jgi:N-acetyl-alpha-D-glucosaminyl L-malate synthase BshA
MFDIQRSIEVIPNFIDASKYEKNKTKPCKRHLVALPEERILTHVSNFRKVKRIPDVIRIFEKVSQELPSKLVMVGDGPEKLKAKKLVDKLGLSNKVHFLGNSSEIDRILCWTDLFLLPSEIESFGLSALEAMANKCAVVSSNAGGLPEVNQNGTTGFLNDIGDIEGMAASAMHILEDQDRLKEFKDRAQEHSFKFDIKVILPLYEAIYDKAYRQARVNQKL